MRRPRVLALQHHPLEHPGVYARALAAGGARLEIVPLFDGAGCPDSIAGYDGLLIMGGPMSVGDDAIYPWLATERQLIRDAIAADLPTLGVCLGAQQIAAAVGATVAPGPTPEVGWYRLAATDAARRDRLFGSTLPFSALQWHRDVFALPPGAVRLASSALYDTQAFRIGRRAYGLLFHLEVDAAMVEQWRDAFIEGAVLPPGDATADFAGAHRRAVTIARRLFLES
jgi:GMP synthase (glutamine-hydrolysing)